MARTRRDKGGPAKGKAAKGKPRSRPAKTAPQVKRLQQELERTRGELQLRTAALDAEQARSEGLKQRLLEIQGSRSYRIAWRLWRIRTRARAPLSRAGGGRPRSRQDDASEAVELPRGPDESLDAAGKAKEHGETPTNAPAPSSERNFEQEFHGSRGVRRAGSERIGPPHAVLLLGGQTETQLREALDRIGRTDISEAEPLVITDCDALRALDAYGFLYEYIPPREDWTERLGLDESSYLEFLNRRLHSIAGTYGLTDLPLEELEPPR